MTRPTFGDFVPWEDASEEDRRGRKMMGFWISTTKPKTIVNLVRVRLPGTYEIVCHGNKRHYRKDGSCRHIDSVLVRMRDWHRSRTRFIPFGEWRTTDAEQ